MTVRASLAMHPSGCFAFSGNMAIMKIYAKSGTRD